MEKEVIKSFKAFDKDMKCREFQYEVGKTYEESEAKACSKGFHGCENPFAVLNYYPLVDDGGNMSRFAEVEQSGEIDRDGDKVCSSRISIKAELSLAGFVKACVEWIKEATQKVDVKNVDNSNYAQIGSSGDYAKIGSSGDSAQIGSEGMYAVICCAGHDSVAKAKVGSWITLSEWEYDEVEKAYIPVCVKTEKVDGEKIKGDTPYKLVNGQFVEV